jgi:hypothetical protein
MTKIINSLSSNFKKPDEGKNINFKNVTGDNLKNFKNLNEIHTLNKFLNTNNILNIVMNATCDTVAGIRELIERIARENKDPELLKIIPTLEGLFTDPEMPFVCKQIRLFQMLFGNFKSGIWKVGSILFREHRMSESQIQYLVMLDLIKTSILNQEQTLFDFLRKLNANRDIFEKADKGMELTDVEVKILSELMKVLYLITVNPTEKRKEYKTYQEFKQIFGCKKGENVVDRFEKIFLSRMGFADIPNVLSWTQSRVENKQSSKVEHVDKFVPEKGDLIKGVESKFLMQNMHQGFFAPEFVGLAKQNSDQTPFDVDFIKLESGGIEEIHNSASNVYGDVFIVLKGNTGRWTDGEKEKDIQQYEGIRQNVVAGSHFCIRTGFAANEVDAFVLKRNKDNSQILQKIIEAIKSKRFYIPIYDTEGKCIFKYDDYLKLISDYEKVKILFEKKDFNDLKHLLSSMNLDVEKSLQIIRNMNPLWADKSVGVSEKYTFIQHMRYVMNQFEKYGTRMVVENKEIEMWLIRFIMLVHDIGKAKAVEQTKDTKKQHIYTQAEVLTIMKEFNFPVEYQSFVLEILSKDFIGNYIKGGVSVDQTVQDIKEAAKKSGKDLKTFYSYLKVYYLIDASSYTSEAGAIGSLDWLFIFDRDNKSLKLENSKASKLGMLEKALFS